MDEIDGYIIPSSPGGNNENFSCERSEQKDNDTLEINSNQFDDLENEDDDESDREEKSTDEVITAKNGVLDELVMEKALNHLAMTAEGCGIAYLHATLTALDLRDISIISEYKNLQKIDISFNKLQNVECLSQLPHLIHIDVSHNELASISQLQNIRHLQYLNASYNNISSMGDFSQNILLNELLLDNNQISSITGLENNKRLKILSIAHNSIENIEGIENLPIRILTLNHNSIFQITNLETLSMLTTLNLSSNNLRILKGLDHNELLTILEVDDNEIIDLSEISRLQILRNLRFLTLNRNPLLQLPDYRLAVIYRLPFLTELDRSKVTTKERVAAENCLNPPIGVSSAREHAMHTVYAVAQPQKLFHSTLVNSQTPYPMLVLVGPHASGKHQLAMHLVEELKDYFKFALSHTTRKPRDDETNGVDYNFVTLDEFESLIKQGRLLQTYEEDGDLYGLTIDAVEDVAKDGFACVAHMELEGVLTLKKTHFEARLLLTMPASPFAHEKRMRDRGGYSDESIERVLKRARAYAEYNREHPGFFDLVICDDELADAYRRLRRVVLDYLGIGGEESPSETVSALQPGFDREYTWGETPLSRNSIGHLERESRQRRQDMAKEAVHGGRLPLYDRIASERAKTVPQLTTDQASGLDGGDLGQEIRVYSAPVDNLDALPPNSPDSSELSSEDTSSFGDLSEARQSETSSRSDDGMGEIDDQKIAEKVDRLDLLSGSHHTMSGTLPAPRPPSSDRPGSNTYPVLPPISSPPVPSL